MRLNKLDKRLIKNKPISEYMHYQVSRILKDADVKTVVDIGGTEKLDWRFKTTNANIRNGIDGADLSYPDGSFDASVSIATLEHVESPVRFLQEAVRVAKKISVHWVHYGKMGEDVEKFKELIGHKHECTIPSNEEIENFMQSLPYTCSLEPFVTCREHLLLLASIYPKLNMECLYDFIYDIDPKTCCGVILTVDKRIKKS